MQYDVVIVGAGPAGLACAIRLKQLKPTASVCVLEKASAVGAHSLSGAVLEPGPLQQLLPEWSREYPGMKVPAAEDDFRILTRSGSFKPVPDFLLKLLPRSMTYSTPLDNHGNYIISLGQLTPWLAHKAESAGVEVSPVLQPRRPCSMSAVVSRAFASATWGWTVTASPAPTSPPAWKSTPPSRCSRKAPAARFPSS